MPPLSSDKKSFDCSSLTPPLPLPLPPPVPPRDEPPSIPPQCIDDIPSKEDPSTIGLPSIECGYIRTLGGIMKCVCICLCLLCFMCVFIGGPGSLSGASWATFVASVGLSITTTLLFLYIFKVVDTLPQVPWIVGEMCFCFAWTIFFFIAACVLAVAASQYKGTAGWAVASFFAFGAMCSYGFDCYLKFLSWKNDEIATGSGPDFIAETQARRRAQNV